ncbi:MAG TPA: protein-disulfide reductase DsbD N-terminal domain-containing protein, partial [Burkholderiales bacterium]
MKRFFITVLLAALALPAAAQFFKKNDELLEPEKAFRFSARAVEGGVEVRFQIADGYYLYRDKFRFAAEGNPAVRLGAPQFPPGIPHRDEFFGESQIYRKQVAVRIPAQGEGAFELKVVSQGCADVGVCYVPMDSQAALRLVGGTFADP